MVWMNTFEVDRWYLMMYLIPGEVPDTWYLISGDCYLVRVGVIATALFSR